MGWLHTVGPWMGPTLANSQGPPRGDSKSLRACDDCRTFVAGFRTSEQTTEGGGLHCYGGAAHPLAGALARVRIMPGIAVSPFEAPCAPCTTTTAVRGAASAWWRIGAPGRRVWASIAAEHAGDVALALADAVLCGVDGDVDLRAWGQGRVLGSRALAAWAIAVGTGSGAGARVSGGGCVRAPCHGAQGPMPGRRPSCVTRPPTPYWRTQLPPRVSSQAKRLNA